MEDNFKKINYSGIIKCFHCSLDNDNKQIICSHCGKDLHLYNKKGELIDVAPEFANSVEKVFELFPEYIRKLVFLANDEKNITQLKNYFLNGQRKKVFELMLEYYKLFGDLSEISYSDIVDKNYEDFEELIVFYSSILSRLILEKRTSNPELMNKKMYEVVSFILGFSSWLIKLQGNVRNDSYDNYNISLDSNELSYLYFRVNTIVDKVKVGKRLDILQDDEQSVIDSLKEDENEKTQDIPKKEEKKRRPSVITIAACILVIFLISSFGIYFGFFKVDLENLKDSVVMVEIYDKYGNELATGSGFCAYQSNLIVTNYHVIEGAYEIKIVTDDDQKYNATSVEIFNAKEDLAILTFDGNLVPLKIGNSDTCKIGQKVYAIGSPVGEKNTVSQGTISNLDRADEIRITTPISHGSSGGALLDSRGRVVGVTFAGYDDAQNLNFAIPVNTLSSLVNSMLSKDFTLITSSTFKNAIKEYTTIEDEMFEKEVIKENKNYASENIKNIYYATSGFSKFDDTLSENSGDAIDVYNNFGMNEKWNIYSYFEALKEYDNSSNLDEAVKYLDSWKSYDWILNLKLMKRWKLAICIEDLENIGDRSYTDVVANYCDSIAPYLIILKVAGGLDYSTISSSYREQVIDYVYELNCTRQTQGKILEELGFRVEYNADGSIVTYY